MDFYKRYLVMYLTASAEMKEAARKHWTKCHAENILSGRDDLIIFSAKMLASIALADELQGYITIA